MNTIRTWDINLFLHIFGWNGRSYIDLFMKLMTRIGDGFLYPVLGVMILLLDWDKGLNTILSGILAFAIELPIYKIIKSKTTRLRPYEAIPGIINLVRAPDKYSFPSGHTAAAFIMAIIIGSVFPVLALPMIILASLIGISRIYLGVHYPTDVLVGMIVGTLSAFFVLKVI